MSNGDPCKLDGGGLNRIWLQIFSKVVKSSYIYIFGRGRDTRVEVLRPKIAKPEPGSVPVNNRYHTIPY